MAHSTPQETEPTKPLLICRKDPNREAPRDATCARNAFANRIDHRVAEKAFSYDTS